MMFDEVSRSRSAWMALASRLSIAIAIGTTGGCQRAFDDDSSTAQGEAGSDDASDAADGACSYDWECSHEPCDGVRCGPEHRCVGGAPIAEGARCVLFGKEEHYCQEGWAELCRICKAGHCVLPPWDDETGPVGDVADATPDGAQCLPPEGGVDAGADTSCWGRCVADALAGVPSIDCAEGLSCEPVIADTGVWIRLDCRVPSAPPADLPCGRIFCSGGLCVCSSPTKSECRCGGS